MAFGLYQTGRAHEAQPVINRALQLSKESDPTRSSIHADLLNTAGTVARACGRFDEARQLFSEALALATALGDESTATVIRLNMGELEFHMGNPARALELVKPIEAETDGFSRRMVTYALINGSAYRIRLGDIAGARVAAREALRLARGAYALETTWAIEHLATVATHGGDPRRGARLRGYVDASYRSDGMEREPTEQRTYDITMAILREKLSDVEIEELAAEGAQLSEDQAVVEALSV